MSDNKKYYYLKLKDNFYDGEEMIMLQSMPGGYVYSDILMKLYLRSLKADGKLRFKDTIPYTPSLLATIIRHKTEDVEEALKIFKELGLIEIFEDGTIYMLELQNFIGESSTEADRIRTYRNKIKTEKGDVHLSYICTPEIEIEKDIEKEIDKEREKEQKIEREYEREIFTAPRVENASEPEREVTSLPLKNGENFSVTEKLMEDLRPCYQGVDVRTEILKMRAWLVANPERRKTSGQVMKFITGWLARTQSNPPPEVKAPPRPGSARFSDLTAADFEENGGFGGVL